MENVSRIIEIFNQHEKNFQGSYWIPESWNLISYEAFKQNDSRLGEIDVNPYSFLKAVIHHLLDSQEGNKESRQRDDLSQGIIYSILPRMFTAWNHFDTEICGGTFLKAICLLPHLKMLKTHIIYLLPVFETSNLHKKGELGSPYAIKNIYRVSTDLHDPLLGEDSQMVEVELKAFVELCHLIGMKVIVDFVFRTCARDNDWIFEHPDWFYWIDYNKAKEFSPPHIEALRKPTPVNRQNMHHIYQSEKLPEYLDVFRPSPEQIDDAKWREVQRKHQQTGENILTLIEENFGITTAPGFSDVMNDAQPPWTDVTYLRLYLDSQEGDRGQGKKAQPPFIVYDVAKASLGKWHHPNADLWQKMIDVIPHYQKTFGIDGARIDMGHALPKELNQKMIEAVREQNPNFLLWSEEFDIKKGRELQTSGFQFMTGGLWQVYPRVERPSFYSTLCRCTLDSKIPIVAALESPDTPRAAWLFKGEQSLSLMLAISVFLPNAILLINNGLELREIQPMNLGLGNTEEGRYVLPKTDDMYGKLAFFDKSRLHWTDKGVNFVRLLLIDLISIRWKYRSCLGSKHFLRSNPTALPSQCFVFSYLNRETGLGVCLIANRMKKKRYSGSLSKILPHEYTGATLTIVYEKGRMSKKILALNGSITLGPKEYIILEIQC